MIYHVIPPPPILPLIFSSLLPQKGKCLQFWQKPYVDQKKKKKGGRGKECSIPFRSRENGVAERAAGIHKTGILLLDLTLRFTPGQGASLLACLVVFISVRRQSQRLSIRALFRCHQSLVLFFTACYLGNEAQGSVPAVIVPAVIVPVGVPVLGFVKVKMA